MLYNYSIIIPYRDTLDLLQKAVAAIPDRDDIQVIIVDNSERPLVDSQIPKKNSADVVYTTSDQTMGAGRARNVGLKLVKGRWLLFLDADDYFTDCAFEAFDEFLLKEYDIVYFKSDSINLKDGTTSGRHIVINQLIDKYQSTGDEGVLRYQFVNPIAKMIRTDFILNKGIKFDEIKVSNDVWFSVMSGHEAKSITSDNAVVYMITAGESGSSLTRIRTKENWFIRFQVMVRVNKFLKTVGKYKYRIHLKGALRIAWRDFGFRECLRLWYYAYSNKVGIL